jgi:hypothetical protein
MDFKWLQASKSWLLHSNWCFPLLITFVYLLLVVFGINGSSTGMYHRLIYGNEEVDQSIIYGKPKSIRSDEYLIFSPTVALQAQTGFPAVNENLGSGREVVIVPEAPMKDWVGFFRPHTFAYFLLPFANAFAFSWWFGFFALLASSYFFFLRTFEQRRILAILLSISFTLSPFIMWWYQVSILLPLAYFFMAAILIMRLLNREKVKNINSQRFSDYLHTIALVYIGASFGLLLYAPFLIPVAIVLAVYIAGYITDGLKGRQFNFKQIKRPLAFIVLAILAVVTIGFIFYLDRREMISAIANSLYPGNRLTVSGELPFSPIYRFFDSFLMPLLPQPPTGSFYTNQSEASNFILLLPFLILPGILVQFFDYIKNKKISYTFLFIQLLAIAFMLRITTPIADSLFNIFLLDRVPNNRLMIGVGLVGFLQLAFLIKNLSSIQIPKRLWHVAAGIFSLLSFIWLLVLAKYYFAKYLFFENNYLIIGSLIVLFTAVIASFLFKKNRLGAILLLIFTLISSHNVLPIQKGMAFYEDSAIINKIRENSSQDDSWAVVDNFTFESLPTIAGHRLINGRQPYADLEFWRQIDKRGEFEDVYNRQAHALFITNLAEPNRFLPEDFATIEEDMELVKGNVFKVKFGCTDFVYDNVNLVLATHMVNLPCLDFVDKIEYPKVTFYIFKVETTN